MYNEKLRLFFKKKNLKQKEIAEILGYSPVMISRYLQGADKINSDFILVLIKKFPEIDLQYIFSESTDYVNMFKEEKEDYNLNSKIIEDIEQIEKKLKEIKKKLARKSHGK